jgi:phosphotransferase system HPr (HPr) family protein
MPERVVRILNRAGLHARPATRLVETTNRFAARIFVSAGEPPVDAKSVMTVLTLAATQGTDLLFQAEGPDAEEALDAIEELARNRFGTEESG